MKNHRWSGAAVAALLACSSTGLAARTPTEAEPIDRGSPPPALVGFGTAAAISGGELFVGRAGQPPGFPMPASSAGGVHIFARVNGEWVERTSVEAEDGEAGDLFGSALAVDGDVLMVASPARDEGRGVVYIFERDTTGWTQTARLQLEGAEAGAGFGSALALHGDLGLIGAPGHAGTGSVSVVTRAGDGWAIIGQLTADDVAPGDRFGAAISLTEGWVLVGAPGEFAVNFIPGGQQPDFRPGAAYVFSETDGDWNQAGKLTSDEQSVAFALQVLWHDGAAFVANPTVGNASGSVLRFVNEGGAWTLADRIATAEPQAQRLFGASLAAGGGDLFVGAPFAGNGAGQVFVMRAGADGWSEAQVLEGTTRSLAAVFGNSLAAAGEWAFVGAPGGEFFEGIGFVYESDGDDWVESGTVVDADGGLPPVTGGQLDCADGSVAGFSCEEVDLVSFLPVDELGGRRGLMVNDLWGWTDPETRREYAIVGRFDGTAFVDVTEPESPRYLGSLPLTSGAQANLWRDMKVYQDHVFIVADNAGEHGVQVFDLTRLRDLDGSEPVTFEQTAHYDGLHSAHNIVINTETGFAYAVGSSGGGETCGGALHMIDVRDPANPTFAGCFGDPATGNSRTGYTHDAQCVTYRGPDEAYRGKEICFNASETALGIADVSDKETPVAISNASYPNVAYAHQGWLSSDHQYFYLNDELDELSGGTERTRTLVWDVKDLDDPVLVNEYLGETEASDHNLYVRGQYMYQSNYVSGLRVMDISDPENPVEVGYFDTVPGGSDTPGFAGSWSNYPFFDSGIILVSSMREGLFILKKRQPELVP